MSRRVASPRSRLQIITFAFVCALLALTPAVSAKQSSTTILGDKFIQSAEPRQGTLFSCTTPSVESRLVAPWISHNYDTWSPRLKPEIDGMIRWPNASFTLTQEGEMQQFTTNGLPVRERTGQFPVSPLDDAFIYSGPPKTIGQNAISGSFAANPSPLDQAGCVDANQPIGISNAGVFIYPAHDKDGLDAVAREVRDRCEGSVNDDGIYYYRPNTPCGEGEHNNRGQIGWARDGFAMMREDRSERGSEKLDACGGHTHALRLDRKNSKAQYHYHQSSQFPYLVGCFRGEPGSNWRWEIPVKELAVSSDPTLSPSFDPQVFDYVTNCLPGAPIKFDVAAPSGTSIAVDGQPAVSGHKSYAISLNPGQAFSFTVHGQTAEQYIVRCLPGDFPPMNFTALQPQTPRNYLTAPGVGPTSQPYVIIFNQLGTPVWWKKTFPYTPFDTKMFTDGNIAYARYAGGFAGVSDEGAYEERGLDGSLQQVIQTKNTPTDHHGMVKLANGNYLATSYKPRDGANLSLYDPIMLGTGTVLDTEIQEITAAGEMVWSWNSKDHIAPAESAGWTGNIFGQTVRLEDGRTAYDILHLSSLAVMGDDILVSLRHANAVYKIDRASGQIIWKMGGSTTANSLQVDGRENPALLGGPHDVKALGSNEITLHDNGTLQGRAPRAVRFIIDEANGTAQEVEQIQGPFASSSCCGSASKLDDGWLIAWGQSSTMIKYDNTGEQIFTIDFGGRWVNSVQEISPDLASPQELRSGMTAMNPR